MRIAVPALCCPRGEAVVSARPVLFRFLSTALMAIALLLAPIGMLGQVGSAMAHAPTVSAPHCAEMDMPADGEDEGSGAMLDCMSICSAVAHTGQAELARLVIHEPPLDALLPRGLVGIHPESDPPPPRFS